MRYGLLALLWGVAFGSACFEATYPPLEPGGTRYLPDSAQRAWWSAVESCSGRRVDIGRVEFVYYDADAIPNTPGWIGRSSFDPRRVETIERTRRHEGNWSHEALHQMIHPIGGHPPEWAAACPQVAGWP